MIDNITDKQLFKRIRDADSVAVDIFINTLHQPYVGFLSKIINPEDARDVAQETYLKMLKRFHRFSNLNHARRFLYKAGYRKAIDFFRKTKRRNRFIQQVQDKHNPHIIHDNLAIDTHDLLNAVNTLTVKQKAVVMLRVQQDLSYREIAGRLGIPTGTALYRMHCALRKLREYFDKEPVVNGDDKP